MYVCFVQHDRDSKRYLFDCTKVEGKGRLDIGTRIICESAYGVVSGTVVSYPANLSDCYQGKGFEEIIKATGAYLPLKKVLEVCEMPFLTESQKETVAKEWFRDKFILDGLPF